MKTLNIEKIKEHVNKIKGIKINDAIYNELYINVFGKTDIKTKKELSMLINKNKQYNVRLIKQKNNFHAMFYQG